MKVQFLVSVGGRDFSYGRGGWYDLPTSEAEYYISKGMAKKVEKEKKAKAVRPLRKPKSKSKKVQTRPVK